jgi:multiple antibiotic resistance protein
MSGAMHFWELILGTVIALLPLINPLAATPAFLAITEGDSEERRREQALKGCLYMVGILVAFLIGGTFIMNFFGLSLPGMRIAGGLLVAGIGASMLSPPAGRAGPDDRETAAARAKRDISRGPLDYGAIILGILFVAGVTYTALRLSGRIVKVIGVNGMSALTRIMGFLLLCVGVQFVVNGVLGVATDPALLRSIRDTLAT